MSKTIDDGKLKSAQDRLTAYAKIALTVDATTKAFSGEAVTAEQFTKKVKDTPVLTSGKKDLWSILNVAISEASKDGATLFQDGSDVASLAVAVDGKVMQVTLTKVDGSPDAFDVSVSKYSLDRDGELSTTPINNEDIRVSRQQDGTLSAQMPGSDVVITQTQFLDRPHQVDAVLASVGLSMQDNGSIQPTSKAVQTAQLITAGTGSGKSGILASAALAHGSGIIAVPDNLLSDAVGDTASFVNEKPVVINDKSTQADLDKALQ